MAQRKFYVVWEGRSPGIYDSWEECKDQVEGFPGARYKAYSSQDEATAAFRGNPDSEMYALRAIARRKPVIVNYDAFPEINQKAIAVDAACAGNPGMMEYRGVDVGTGAELFHFGPVPDGTNNIGEFLAIVHAMALLVREGRTDIAIYSDSKTGMGWVNRGKANTKITPTPGNAYLRQLIARAEAWLAAHPASVRPRLLKWDTENWGEIPADFGRK